MEPFTLAGIVALVLVGIFNKTGEVIVEESVEQIKKQLAEKSPDTLKGSSCFCVEARRIGIIFWKDSLQSLA